MANREQEGIQILTLTGQLTFGQEDLDIRTELNRFIAAGKTRSISTIWRDLTTPASARCSMLTKPSGRLVAPWQLSTYTDPISNSWWKQNWEPY